MNAEVNHQLYNANEGVKRQQKADQDVKQRIDLVAGFVVFLQMFVECIADKLLAIQAKRFNKQMAGTSQTGIFYSYQFNYGKDCQSENNC